MQGDLKVAGCRAVFLDRDGVLNRAIVRQGRPYPPKDLSELEILPGVVEALRLLKADNFKLFVVTNQPDVGRGMTRREVVEAINDELRSRLPLDAVVSCFHSDSDNCACRKPKPGMPLSLARQWGVDLSRSFMVGDRWRDIEAGVAAGCTTVFLDYGYAEQNPAARSDYVCRSLFEAATWIAAAARSSGDRPIAS
jgi:D-glycero-D-manno-heptose 1,7-bisphosphate phosphatase